MLGSFLKATVRRRTVFIDSWILLIASFVFSFILVFSFSMARSLLFIDNLIVRPVITIDKSLDAEDIAGIFPPQEYGSYGIESADRVKTSYGILENREYYRQIMLKQVDDSYFTSARRRVLGLDVTALQPKQILISSVTAKELRLAVGDKVAFVNSADLRPSMFTVCGIFETGLNEFDRNCAYCKLRGEEWDVEISTADDFGMELFSGLRTSSVHIDSVYSRLSDSVEPYNVHLNYDNDRNIVFSLYSVRFVLFLFMMLALAYSFAVVKNFDRRNLHVCKLFGLLGCSRIRLLRLAAILSVSFVSSATGMLLGTLSAFLVPRALMFANTHFSLDFDYYLLSFDIYVPYRSLLVFELLLFAATMVAGIVRRKPYHF